MNTPFGIANLWLEGDFVTRFVAIALLACSIITWVILLTRFWELRNIRKLKPELDQFWKATSYEQGLQSFSNQDLNPFYQLAKSAATASAHHQNQAHDHRELLQTLNYSEWMARSLKNGVDGIAAGFQKGLTFLGSTGAISPFIGLFGTVIGVINSFNQIGLNASVSLAVIGPGLAEALYATALGLFVAVPASIFYNLINFI